MAISGFSTSNYLGVASSPVTAAGFTVSAWAKFASVAALQALISFCNSADTTNRWVMNVSPTGKAQITAGDGGGTGTAAGVTTLTTGTWYHLCAQEIATTDRHIYLNGVHDGSNNALRSPSGINQTVVGARGGSAITVPLSDAIGEVAVYGAVLDADEIVALAAGFSPLLVRRTSLLTYWPLVRLANMNNRFSGHNLAATGSPTDADHCRVIRPAPLAGGFRGFVPYPRPRGLTGGLSYANAGVFG